jgi:CheY-like chemotaxis protein
MSHEIRTPLKGVIGFTDLLKNTNLSELQQEYVNNANISGHTLLGIINEILDFSKIEAGMLELEYIKTDIIKLLENCVDIVNLSASKKNVEFILDIDSQLPRFAEVDPIRLKQIIINLLSNAVKFTDKGEVELKVRFSLLTENDGQIFFEIRDTGIGISDSQKEKLFKPFSQADTSTTRKFGGTGLGLVISEMIAQKMGTQISIKSEIGVGSTFSFELITSIEEGEKLKENLTLNVKNCLIIDDNANNRRILEDMLSQWQIHSESCENGFEAIKRLENPHNFDVIICDYNMPYLDGLDTIRLIKDKLNISLEQHPVIILHSSSDDSEIYKKCEALGIKFNLTKPVKSDELYHTLCNFKQFTPKSALVTESDKVSAPISSTPSTEKIKILIADDVPMNLMLLKGILS